MDYVMLANWHNIFSNLIFFIHISSQELKGMIDVKHLYNWIIFANDS